MAIEPLSDLFKFLNPFDKEVQATALKLREFVLDLFPDTNELIYDNYNALAIGYSFSDKQKEMFCHIAVYSKYVNIGFDHDTTTTTIVSCNMVAPAIFKKHGIVEGSVY